MATTTGVRLTKAGEALLAKVHAGTVAKLELTNFVIGDSVWTEQEIEDADHIALKNERVSAPIINIIAGSDANAGRILCSGVINNISISESFYVREIGMMAKDPDLGEILYLIDPIAEHAPTTVIEGNAVSQDVPISMQLIAVSRDQVELILSESVAYVTPEQLQQASNSIYSYINDNIIKYSLTNNLSIYVSTMGSDNNDGLTPQTPFATAQKTTEYINKLKFNGYSVLVYVDGDLEGLIGTFIFDKTHDGLIYLSSKDTTNLSSITSIYVSIGTGVVMENIAFNIYDAPTTYSGIIVAEYFGNLMINGKIIINDKTTASKNARSLMLAQRKGQIRVFSDITINTSSKITFNGAVMRSADNGCLLLLNGSTFSGDAQHKGQRYSLSTNSLINTYGAGENFIPGSEAGVIASGGIYA